MVVAQWDHGTYWRRGACSSKLSGKALGKDPQMGYSIIVPQSEQKYRVLVTPGSVVVTTGRWVVTPGCVVVYSLGVILTVVVCGRDQEILRGWHDEDVASLGGEDVMSRPILQGYPGFRIVLHLTRRLSEILWKVGEGIGSSWKLMEDLEAFCRRL
ncbi:hypothetical protein Tco_0045486 [Tanacetum coccineum]